MEQRISAAAVKRVFREAADFVARPLVLDGVSATAFFIDGLTSGADIAEYVLQPASGLLRGSAEEMLEQCLSGTVYSAVAKPVEELQSLCNLLVNGFCVLVFDGLDRAVAFEAKTPEKRAVAPPTVENTVKGPKDAFTETFRTNTSLIRRHLRSPWLRIHESKAGSATETNVAVVWLEGTTDPGLVARLRLRLAACEAEGLLSPAAVERCICPGKQSAFPLLQYTERTDKFCAGLLAGKVGLLVDGLPLGYLAPAVLTDFMTSPEDHGMDPVPAACVRVLRYLALLVSLLLPALFAAMAMFHAEMIPTKLLHAIIESKKQVPFPAAVELLGLLAAFEILQEAGIQLPRSLGQTVSIIGGLVVGTAAVEAKLISPAALIVVSTAGICGYAIPGREAADAVRVWRFGLTAAAAAAGLFGLTVGLVALLLHLGGLESFGESYLNPFDRAKSPVGISEPECRKGAP